ncbi:MULTISPECIES: tyrosine-type recombinase/integrase [unclassified Alteromonas]|uniref:tyrosine-type recombinase/integrase n=1 Tax=unclassified Alteromonas TaxID=2614992 RepID=UPI0012FDE896
MRRGFAHWANHQGWSLHELMQYVGWKDIQSAMRYLNHSEAFPNRITANEP